MGGGHHRNQTSRHVKKIAAIITVYRPRSHADVLVGKFLHGFPTDGALQAPRVKIASLYVDQTFDNDMSGAISEQFGIPVYPSIVGALTLGGDELAVDGVLLIGEHGDYAWNEKQQQLYPRRYFMEQIAGGDGRGGPGRPGLQRQTPLVAVGGREVDGRSSGRSWKRPSWRVRRFP